MFYFGFQNEVIQLYPPHLLLLHSFMTLPNYIVQTHKCATTEFGQYMSISSANSSFLSQSLFEEANKEYDVSTLTMG